MVLYTDEAYDTRKSQYHNDVPSNPLSEIVDSCKKGIPNEMKGTFGIGEITFKLYI
jgi:hypothetical protein